MTSIQQGALVRWDSFSRELEKARTLEEVKELADKAKAVEVYCRNAKKGLPIVNTAITWWLRSARKAGGLLAKEERKTGPGRGKKMFHAETSFRGLLKNNNLTVKTAWRWQNLAKISEKKFERFLTMFITEEELLSMAALMKLFSVPESEIPPLPHGKFRVIYADPPFRLTRLYSICYNRLMSPKQIIALRKRLKVTQEKLGQLVGAHQVTVARWEMGVNQPEGAYLVALKKTGG